MSRYADTSAPAAPAASVPLHMLRLLSALFLLAVLMLGMRSAHADEEYLDPEAAFKFSAHMVDGHTVAVSYQIADGYYMYRERFHFAATGATLGTPNIPPGTIHFDTTFQKRVE